MQKVIPCPKYSSTCGNRPTNELCGVSFRKKGNGGYKKGYAHGGLGDCYAVFEAVQGVLLDAKISLLQKKGLV